MTCCLELAYDDIGRTVKMDDQIDFTRISRQLRRHKHCVATLQLESQVVRRRGRSPIDRRGTGRNGDTANQREFRETAVHCSLRAATFVWPTAIVHLGLSQRLKTDSE